MKQDDSVMLVGVGLIIMVALAVLGACATLH